MLQLAHLLIWLNSGGCAQLPSCGDITHRVLRCPIYLELGRKQPSRFWDCWGSTSAPKSEARMRELMSPTPSGNCSRYLYPTTMEAPTSWMFSPGVFHLQCRTTRLSWHWILGATVWSVINLTQEVVVKKSSLCWTCYFLKSYFIIACFVSVNVCPDPTVWIVTVAKESMTDVCDNISQIWLHRFNQSKCQTVWGVCTF